MVLPSDHDGLRASGLRFGGPRVVALLASIACFTHVVGGLTNAGLRRLMSSLFHPEYTTRQAGHDLTRLRRKGFLHRIPGTRSYRITLHLPAARGARTGQRNSYGRVVARPVRSVSRAVRRSPAAVSALHLLG